MSEYDGILLIDKPKGWTSFDVVAKVRGQIQAELRKSHQDRGFCMEMQRKDVASNAGKRTKEYDERVAQQPDAAMRSKPAGVAGEASQQSWRCKCRAKVGHTGTLDPLATGLMIVVLGTYCKRAGEFSKLSKTYDVTMKLGQTSSTDDEEGEKTNVSDKKPTVTEVKQAIEQFVGEIQQTPPAFSAIKVDGKRAYKLAREGKEVTIEPRTVTVHSITEVKYNYPTVTFTTDVSSGTYIRSLARDIGEKLGTGAYLTDLRRTKVDMYSIEQAISIDQARLNKIMVA